MPRADNIMLLDTKAIGILAIPKTQVMDRNCISPVAQVQFLLQALC